MDPERKSQFRGTFPPNRRWWSTLSDTKASRVGGAVHTQHKPGPKLTWARRPRPRALGCAAASTVGQARALDRAISPHDCRPHSWPAQLLFENSAIESF